MPLISANGGNVDQLSTEAIDWSEVAERYKPQLGFPAALTPAATDTAFRQALGGDFTSIDALIAREKALLTPYDRLRKLFDYHMSAGMYQKEVLAQSSRYVSGAYRADARKRYERHRVAVRALLRRLGRIARRGEL